MKFDFTEGEWTVRNKYKVDTKNNTICNCSCGCTYPNINEKEANARLISCAPEMLNALIEICKAEKEAVTESDDHNVVKLIYNMSIEKIIEKATGKTWSVINE